MINKLKSEYIKKAMKAFVASVLISSLSLIVAPIIAFMLLLFGIAALPYWRIIIVTVTMLSVLVPGILITIGLTKGIPLSYRVLSIILYLAFFGSIEIAFFFWWRFRWLAL